MNFIVEFYQSLDALNVIIFWGIIIVILLLIVFVILMLNKNKQNKSKTNNKSSQNELYSDEIALPSNSRDTLIMKDDNLLIQEEKQTNFEPFVIPEPPVTSEKVEVEKNFQAEEHVMAYDHELFNLSHVKKNNELPPEEQKTEPLPEKQPFQMPTKPYERNVLREMSLGQTSPIGIIRQDNSYTKLVSKPKESSTNSSSIISEKKIEKAPISNQPTSKIVVSMPTSNIDESPQVNKAESSKQDQIITLERSNHSNKVIDIPKKEQPNNRSLEKSAVSQQNFNETKVVNKPDSTKQTEIVHPIKYNDSKSISETIPREKPQQLHVDTTYSQEISVTDIKPKITKEQIIKPKEEINLEVKFNPQPSNATFLEEVSKKLAEAEVPDEIDRTDYELQQEEDAIISYKELMAKKDTIKTIDEEDAVISIQELTARKSQQEKLYNLTEEEENNDFIDELKKFRNDLN